MAKPRTLRAAVFINWSTPLCAGHVGWGFEVAPGCFWFGAVELTSSVFKWAGSDAVLFSEYAPERRMLAKMKSGDHGGSGFVYHAYKYISVRDPDVCEPLKVIEAARQNGHALLGSNCVDSTFRVIKAYANGDDRVLPWPSTHWEPRSFFAAIPAEERFLQADQGLFGYER